MKSSQLTKGAKKRLMYVENKDGLIDGERARIGWVEFSKTGRTVRYRGRSLIAIGGRGGSANFLDEDTREQYWVSGVKVRGSNAHPSAPVRIVVDDDAVEAYDQVRGCV
jgi:hypothetical protein